jgi:hypothetical protein
MTITNELKVLMESNQWTTWKTKDLLDDREEQFLVHRFKLLGFFQDKDYSFDSRKDCTYVHLNQKMGKLDACRLLLSKFNSTKVTEYND